VVAAEIENPVVVAELSRIEDLPIEKIHGIFVGDPPSDALVKSVGKRGVINLPTVREVDWADGEYEVVDGRRRLRALLLNGKTVAEVVVNNSVEDVSGASLVSNYLRSENVIQAAREVWARMDAGETDKDIAEEEDINIAQIRGLRDMRKLLPELIAAVEAGQMKSWAARMAARHPAEVQQQLVERLKANGKVTADDVKEVRSVKRAEAVSEVEDLFENLPELDDVDEMARKFAYGEYDGTGDDVTDDDEEDDAARDNYLVAATADAAPKVKVARKERLENVQALVGQAKKEILAIKSNVRSGEEVKVLGLLEDILAELTNVFNSQ
jgi:ParB/RepB/Spo0J family partition protein